MSKRFQDKIVIVTGSSNGIGRATAQRFAEEGAKVTITGRRAESLEETKKLLLQAGSTEDRICEVLGDLTIESVQQKVIDDTVAKFGGIDVLINNAGGVAPDMTETDAFDQDIECFDYVIQLNTRAVIKLMKTALPFLIKSKGEIVNVSSIAALSIAWTSVPYYAASKSALDQLTRAFAIHYIKDGVRVNSVNPGAVETDIMQKQGKNIDWNEVFAEDRHTIPLGRVGTPNDIAEAILFLSDRKVSGFVVGHSMVVDGGSSISVYMSHKEL